MSQPDLPPKPSTAGATLGTPRTSGSKRYPYHLGPIVVSPSPTASPRPSSPLSSTPSPRHPGSGTPGSPNRPQTRRPCPTSPLKLTSTMILASGVPTTTAGAGATAPHSPSAYGCTPRFEGTLTPRTGGAPSPKFTYEYSGLHNNPERRLRNHLQISVTNTPGSRLGRARHSKLISELCSKPLGGAPPETVLEPHSVLYSPETLSATLRSIGKLPPADKQANEQEKKVPAPAATKESALSKQTRSKGTQPKGRLHRSLEEIIETCCLELEAKRRSASSAATTSSTTTVVNPTSASSPTTEDPSATHSSTSAAGSAAVEGTGQ